MRSTSASRPTKLVTGARRLLRRPGAAGVSPLRTARCAACRSGDGRRAELVGEPRADALVGGERVGLAPGGVERRDVAGGERARGAGDRRARPRARRRACAPWPRASSASARSASAPGAGLRAARRRRRSGWLVRSASAGPRHRRAPRASVSAALCGSPLAQRGAPVGGELLEAVRVDAVGAQPVAARARGDRVGVAERAAQRVRSATAARAADRPAARRPTPRRPGRRC